MAKGIIIDVGFQADIKDFIKDIEKDFKKVDFDSIIGLSESFDKQAKEVKQQLSKLKEEIDNVVNGKVSGDPSKQLQALNKAVGVLTSSFKELMKNMPGADKGLLSQLDEITSEVGHLSDICGNASDAVEKLKKTTKGEIKFVNSNQKKELEEIFYLLERAREASDNMSISKKQHGNKPYDNIDDALRDLINTYQIYAETVREINRLGADESLSSEIKIKEMDKLNTSLAYAITNLDRMITTYAELDGNWKKISIPGTKRTLDALQNSLGNNLDVVLDYISKRKIEIQQAYSELGGGDLQDMFMKGVKKGTFEIPIPLRISTKQSTLLSEALSLIQKAQDKLQDNPLEIEVRLISASKSKANKEILNKITAGLKNINDEEVRNDVLSLIDKMNKDIDNALLFNVNVNVEKAYNSIKGFVKDAKESLDELTFLKPEIILTPEHKKAFQKQLEEAKGDFKIQVGIMDGDDTIDNNATKRELAYITNLKKRINEVADAVANKSLAFIEEEEIVKDVVNNERTYLNQLYADLILIETQVEEIANAFKLIPTMFKIDFDKDTLEAFNKLSNHEVLSALSKAKESIFSAVSTESGGLIEIPEDQKQKLLNDINKLSLEINTIFETKGIDNWTSKFLSSLNEISQKIKTLFGNNALTDMIEQWTFSDEIMKSVRGDEHLRERAAIIDDKGNIYGSGTYDQEGSTRFGHDIVEKLRFEDIVPKIGVHSHSSDRIVASSIPQIMDELSGDLVAFYQKYINYGLEKQLTIALNDIELFDAKGFYDSNKSVDFMDQDINNLIVKKQEEITAEINQHFYQFFQQFVSQYGSEDAFMFKNALFNYATVYEDDEFLNLISKSVNPTDLLNNFYKNTKTHASLEDSLVFAFQDSVKNSKIDYESLGVSKEIFEKCINEYIHNIMIYKKEILDEAFGISKFNYDNYGRDLDTFNFRQVTPRILKEALAGTGYKNNYEDFMRVYSIEDFIKQNPLELSSGSLSNLFDNAAPAGFLNTLDKIVEDLKEIKDFSSNNELKDIFNIKFDNDSLLRFTESINQLILKLEQLFASITGVPSFENQLSKSIKGYIELLDRQNKVSNSEDFSWDEYNKLLDEEELKYTPSLLGVINSVAKDGKFNFNYGEYDDKYWTDFANAVITKAKEMGVSLDDLLVKTENTTSALGKNLNISNAFDIKIDEGVLKLFIEEINKLIESLEKLPGVLTEAFSNFNNIKPNGQISSIDEEIEKLNVQLEETEQQIKDIESQLNKNVVSNERTITNRIAEQAKEAAEEVNKLEESLSGLSLYENILKLTAQNKQQIASGKDGLPEQALAANIYTGYSTDFKPSKVAGTTMELVYDRIQSAIEPVNTLLHSHPEEFTAAFSFDDIEKAAIQLGEGIIFQIATSLNDLAMLDVSVFTKEDLLKIYEKFRDISHIEVSEEAKQKGYDYYIDEDAAFSHEFKNNLNENVQYIFNNIIDELKKINPEINTSEFKKKLEDQLDVSKFSFDSEEEVYKSLQSLYMKVAKSFNITDDSVFDNVWGSADFYSKMLMDFQESMLRKAVNDLSATGELSTEINFDDIYKKFSFDGFGEYLSAQLREMLEQGIRMSGDTLERQIDNSRRTSKKNDSVDKPDIISESDNTSILEEQLKKLKEKQELLIKQIELLKEQKRLSQSQDVDVSGITDKTDAFQTEGTTVDTVIDSEIKKLNQLEQKLDSVTDAVNRKTEAFREEEKVVGEVVDGEMQALNPLQKLESSFNNFKKFYDNNDLESEAGAQAALSYYNAYKEALSSKVNKKDLQPFTIGKMDDLFTGNYTNYKKGLGDLDLSGLNAQITKYQEIVDKFNQPEVISIINALTEAIEKLLAAGNSSAEATALLKNLNNVINNLGGKNSTEKIERIAKNLENFQKSIQTLDISDSGFVKSLSSILEKGEELKVLGEVLKSTKKQIDAAGKAIKEESELGKAQEYLEKYENNIRESVNQKHLKDNETVLYQKLEATKDGLVQIVALIKDAKDEYKQFVYTATDGSNLKVKSTLAGEDPALAKYIKQWEEYQKEKDNLIPGVGTWGYPGESFTPDSSNYQEVINKAKEFGIEAENIVKILRNLDRAGHESFQIFTKLSRITIARNSNGILFQNDEVFNKDVIEKTKKEIKILESELKNAFKGTDLYTEDFLNTLNEVGNKLEYINHLNKLDVIQDEDLQDLQKYYEIFKNTIYSISLEQINKKNKNPSPQFNSQLQEAENQLVRVKHALDKVGTGEAFSDEDIVQVKTFIDQMRTLYNTVGNKESKLASVSATQNLLGKITDVLDKNTAMSKELRQEFILLSDEITSFGDKLPADKLTEFGARFKTLETQMKQSGQTGLGFFDGIIKRAKSMSQSFISMYLSLWDIVRYVRTGVTYIQELDTAFTEMRKVSDESVQSLRNFQSASFDIAGAVGTTAQQIQNSTADWMRLGESLEQASESAKVSNILFNVSEFESIDEATDSLVSMAAAYNELDKIDIVDKLNQVGNNFSISTDGLATALQRSASALTTAGNDMDEAVALVTAGNAVVQDADSVGAGLRTIALRITGTEAAKEELESLGENVDDFVVQTTSKSQQAIKDFTRVASNNFEGFDILDDNGNFKSTYEIMLGIAEIYDEIVETDKEYGSNMANGLLETLAGKNRANIAASILQNSDLLKSVYESSQDSSGSAEKELEKYLDSIEGKISKFTNEVQEFWYNLISSDTIKTIVDIGTAAVDIIGDIVGALGEVGTLITAIVSSLSIKSMINGGGFFKTIEDEAAISGLRIQNNFNQALSGITSSSTFSFGAGFEADLTDDVASLQNYIAQLQAGIPAEQAFSQTMRQASVDAQQFAQNMNTATISTSDYEIKAKQSQISIMAANKSFGNAKTLIDEYNGGLKTCGLTQEQFVTSVKESNVGLGNYLTSLNGAKGSLGGYITSLVGAKAASLALQAATMAMNMALTMGISMLVTAGISAISKFVDDLHQTRDELKETADEIRTTYRTASEEITSNLDTISGLESEFEKLSKGVSTYGENISLTSDEYQRYQEIVSQIIGTNPALIEGYNSEGKAIANKNTLLETSINLLKEKQKLELQEYISDKSIKTLGMDAVEDINDYIKENPLPYGNAKFDFITAFAKAADRYDADNKYENNYDLFKALSPEGYNWNDYGSGSVHAKNFAQEYFKQIVADLRSEEGILRKYFTSDEVENLLDFANQYDQNIVKYDAKIEGYAQALNLTLQIVAQAEEGYDELSDVQKSFISAYINNLKVSADMTEDEILELKYQVKDFVSIIKGEFNGLTDEESKALTDMFDIQTQFDNNKISVSEYQDKLTEFLKILEKMDSLPEETVKDIKLLFNIETNENGTISSNVDTMIENVKGVLEDEFENSIRTLTLSDLKIASEISADFDENSLNIDELLTQIDFSKYLGKNVAKNVQDVLDNLGLTYDADANVNVNIDTTLSETAEDLINSSVVQSAGLLGGVGKVFVTSISKAAEQATIKDISYLDPNFISGVDTYIQKTNQLKIALGKLNDGTLTNNEIQELAKDFELTEEQTKNLDVAIVDLLGSMQTDMIDQFSSQFGKVDSTSDRRELEKFMADVIELGYVVGNTSFSINIATEKTGIESLSAAMQESVSATGLSAESISNLKARYAELEEKGYDLDKLFEETTNGIHLNRQALNELEKAYNDQNIDKIDYEINRLQNNYDVLTEAINNCTDATTLQKFYSQRDDIVAEMNALGELAAQYEGLSSAYNKWQIEQNAGNERDMYEGIISGREEIEDEMKRGWLDDDTRAYLELLSGKDLSLATYDELLDVYKALNKEIKGGVGHSVFDFFTTNDDGESTSKGVFNFLDTVNSLEDELAEKLGKNKDELKNLVKINKDGSYSFDFSIVAEKDENGHVIKNGDEVIADALGISEEIVQILLRAADDAGFVINLEGAYTQLADFKTSAEEANNSLNKLYETSNKKYGTDYEFNFNATGDELLEERERAEKLLEQFKVDGKVDMSLEGAKEALEVVYYFNSMYEKLNEPVYMNLKVDDVEKELQEPLEKLQRFEELSQEEYRLTLVGDAEGIEEVQTEMEGIVDYIYNNNELKATLKLEEDASKKEIEEKLRNGEIEFPATAVVDVQVEINDNLEKLVDISLYNAGIIDEKELELRLNPVVEEEVNDIFTEKEITIDAIVEVFNAEDVGDLEAKLNSIDDETIKVIAEVFGNLDVEKLKTAVNSLDDKTIQAIVEAIGSGDVESLKNIIDSLDDETVQILAEAFGYEEVEDLKKAISELDGKTIQAIAEALGIEDVDSLKESIDNLNDKTVKAIAETYGKSGVDGLKTAISNLKSKTVNIVAKLGTKGLNTVKSAISGFAAIAQAEGTAHADGTSKNAWGTYRASIGAYARGNEWSLPRNESALVNELGTESIVRDGKWFTIPGGAHVEQLKKGDIIFSAAQTEELLRTGRVTSGGGHGKVAYATGTAFNMINAYSGSSGSGPGSTTVANVAGEVSKSSGKSKSSSSKSSSDSADEFEETLDWIERKIQDIERDIENLDQTASSTYKSWSSRNSALVKEMSLVSDEIDIQNAAYKRYMQEANSVGLSDKYKKLVQEGKIDIQTITDEDLADKISEYQEYYDKAIECKDATQDLQDRLAELARQKFDNVVQQYDDKLSAIEHEVNVIDGLIEQTETSGHIISGEYYKELIKQEKKNKALLEKEYSDLQTELANAMRDGDIVAYSEEWYAMQAEINGVQEAIIESDTALIEFNNNLRQLEWDAFDRLQEKISNISSEAEFLISLMEDSDLYDDKGQLTDTGMATMGLHAQNYNTYMAQADKYAEEMKKIEEDLAKDPGNQDLIERRQELLELQQESILAANDEKQAIRDMVEEGINLELESLQNLIDKYNEAQQNAKDLYDYQKNIEEQTKNISALEKQMSAYQGDTSEENRQRVQQIKLQLEEAKENLEETEMEHALNESQKMLDELYTEYEEILNERLDNIDMLLGDMIERVNANSSDIHNTLVSETDKVGYTLTESMQDIWSNEGCATAIISKYGDDFNSQLTSVNYVLNAIAEHMGVMLKQQDEEAKDVIKDVQDAPVTNPAASDKPKETPKAETPKAETSTTKTIKVGGKINAGSAKIYDYAGDTTGERQYFRSDPIYTVLAEKSGYLKVRHHKQKSGVTGWFKKSDVKAYKTGGLVDETGLAWLDGTKGKPELVLNAQDTENFVELTDVLRKIDVASLTPNMAPMFDSLTPMVPNFVPNTSQNMNNEFNIKFELHDVQNGEDVINYLIKSDRFENAVKAMTVDRLVGGSKFAKNKYHKNI